MTRSALAAGRLRMKMRPHEYSRSSSHRRTTPSLARPGRPTQSSLARSRCGPVGSGCRRCRRAIRLAAQRPGRTRDGMFTMRAAMPRGATALTARCGQRPLMARHGRRTRHAAPTPRAVQAHGCRSRPTSSTMHRHAVPSRPRRSAAWRRARMTALTTSRSGWRAQARAIAATSERRRSAAHSRDSWARRAHVFMHACAHASHMSIRMWRTTVESWCRREPQRLRLYARFIARTQRSEQCQLVQVRTDLYTDTHEKFSLTCA